MLRTIVLALALGLTGCGPAPTATVPPTAPASGAAPAGAIEASATSPVRVVARVEADHERGELRVELELHAQRPSPAREAQWVLGGPITVEALECRAQTQTQASCTASVVGDRLRATASAPVDRWSITARYTWSPGPTGDYVGADDLVLRGEAGWLPTDDGRPVDYDVAWALDDPDAFVLVGQGEVTHAPEQIRWHHVGSDLTIYGAREYAQQRLDVAGTALFVGVWPRDEEHLPMLVDQARRALQSLEPLGPYPQPSLNVVEGGLADGYGGYGAPGNVTIGWRSVTSGGDPAYVAHEIAHGWFGGMVLAPLDGAPWTEAVADYVSTWAVTPEARAELVVRWTEDAAALPLDQHIAVADVRPSDPWPVISAVGYARGALLLLALEDRLGRPAMVAMLVELLRTKQGSQARWDDLVAALRSTAGEDEAQRFADALAQPAPPPARDPSEPHRP